MKYKITLDIEDTPIDYIIGKFKIYGKVLDVENVKTTRTSAQNRALHLWFTQLAQALNEKNFDMRAVIRQDVNIEWSGATIKEYLFKPLLKARFGKKSTTQLFKSGELDDLYDIINKVIIERTGGEVEVPMFPSFDNMLIE